MLRKSPGTWEGAGALRFREWTHGPFAIRAQVPTDASAAFRVALGRMTASHFWASTR
jgi:hypothetical protein